MKRKLLLVFALVGASVCVFITSCEKEETICTCYDDITYEYGSYFASPMEFGAKNCQELGNIITAMDGSYTHCQSTK